MSETLIGAGRDLAVGELAVGELAVGPLDVRCGNGFDVHAFCPGDHVMLCGVAVPHDSGLLGHSDADVGMHALTDAIYGALARGDIGRHFPPDDPQWKGAASSVFLTHACDLARQMGLRLSNADVTLICEHPKIGPHAAEMAAVLARICGIDAARVSVKATTSERLGFTGRGEGIAALATVTLMSGGSGATASGGSARPGSVTAGGAAPDGVQAAPAPPATDARDVAARAAAPPVSIAPDAAAPGLRTSAAAAPGSGLFPAPQVTPPPGPDIPSAAPAVRR